MVASQSGLWAVLDQRVAVTQSRPSTASSMIMLHTYQKPSKYGKEENSLKWWLDNKKSFLIFILPSKQVPVNPCHIFALRKAILKSWGGNIFKKKQDKTQKRGHDSVS